MRQQDPAWRKSARDSVIRTHGREAATPQTIEAKLEEILLLRERREQTQVGRAEAKLPPGAPAGSYTRQMLAGACGFSLSHLRHHRLRNAAGIADAVFKLSPTGNGRWSW